MAGFGADTAGMTNEPTLTAPGATAPADLPDPRPGLAAALDVAGSVIAGIEPGHLDRATPCAEWTVLDLARHQISMVRRLAAVARGEHWSVAPELATDVAVDDLARAWTAARAGADEVWADPSVLGRFCELPFGTLPGAAVAAVYTAELSVHAWDLAAATGESPAWDDRVLAAALVTVQQGIPAEGRGAELPFDPVVPTAPDAPAIDRLVAWLGRHP